MGNQDVHKFHLAYIPRIDLVYHCYNSAGPLLKACNGASFEIELPPKFTIYHPL